jgi:hypothetical protein
MNSKMKKEIRSIILEAVDELFSVSTEEEQASRLARDSVDDQIDSFILKFEKDSIVSDDSPRSLDESLSALSLSALLEQDIEEEEAATEDAIEAEEEEGAGAPADDEEQAPADSSDAGDTAPAEGMKSPPLDVDSFTKRVARLSMNFDTLLDVKSTIINRAINFLKENYDEEHVEEMKEILDTQFDFNVDGEKEPPHRPYAVGAWAGGTGGLGGGGGT